MERVRNKILSEEEEGERVGENNERKTRKRKEKGGQEEDHGHSYTSMAPYTFKGELYGHGGGMQMWWGSVAGELLRGTIKTSSHRGTGTY